MCVLKRAYHSPVYIHFKYVTCRSAFYELLLAVYNQPSKDFLLRTESLGYVLHEVNGKNLLNKIQSGCFYFD